MKSVVLVLTVVVLGQTLLEAEGNFLQKISNGAEGILNVCRTNGDTLEFFGSSRPTGDRCVFPFRYGGETYMSCTRRNWYRHWCATAVDAGGNLVEYGECCRCTDWWCVLAALIGIETSCNPLCPCEHGCP